MEITNSKHLYVIDGNSLLFRAFYATYMGDPSAIMRTKSGIPTNAIFAFSNMLVKFLQKMKPGDSIFVAFDKDGHTFRKEQFASYKANRKPAPEELVAQFPISRELMKALNITFYEEHGIEADDIAGTIAKSAEKEGYQVDVYTSDKDYLQLITDHVTVHLLRKGLSDIDDVTPSKMVEEFGFTPKQIIDYKGLRGDASDNLPGIPGVGEKTAAKLIEQYHTFDAIIQAAKNGEIKGKLCQNIVENEAMGRQCYELATMKTDCVLPFQLSDFIYKGFDPTAISSFSATYELKQLPLKMPVIFKMEAQGNQSAKAPEVQKVHSIASISLPSKIGVAIDLDPETYNDAPVLGIAFSDGISSYYIDAQDAQKDEAFQALLKNPSIIKNVNDAKRMEVGLHRLGIEIQGIGFDILLAAYLINSNVTDRPDIVYSSFGVDVSSSAPSLLFDVDHSEGLGKEAFYALKLEQTALDELEKADALRLFRDIELPLSHVLAQMEIEGFPLKADELEEIGKEYRNKKDQLEQEIVALAGHPFNPASPKQIASVLYDELGLKGPKSRSTSIDVLNELVSAHPIVEKILSYRKYAKLVGTYIDGLLPHIKKDGKIHTCFNQAQTTTGRLSSSNPNLQNISARDEESKLIRKAFHYDDPNTLILSLDYGQIELRILAALSHCQDYIDVFESGRDVHSETARKIFHLSPDEPVPHEFRRKAKAINFAIVYGTTAFGLAEQIGGTPKEAKDIIDHFNREYPEIAEFSSDILEGAERDGYVTTMFGRRRYLPDLKDANYAKREAAKRAALNAPVQGSAADLIKIAMLKVDEFLSKGHYRSKMVLQIHDELLFALDASESSSLIPELKAIMENAVKLPVKLTVEGNAGKSWYDAKD